MGAGFYSISGRALRREVWAILAALLFLAASVTAAEEVRYVPQIGLTDLEPRKVAWRPDDDDTLMVVNDHGRIDLFDIADPNRPIKTAEIFAGAADASFSPDGALIASKSGSAAPVYSGTGAERSSTVRRSESWWAERRAQAVSTVERAFRRGPSGRQTADAGTPWRGGPQAFWSRWFLLPT